MEEEEIVSVNNLLEAGVQFGHQKKYWNPKMKEYIFNSREDIYIIDLKKTTECLNEAYVALRDIAKKEGKIVFVGTKRQAKDAVKEVATRTESAYVNERWLGGTLTNFRVIRQRVKRLEEIEDMGTSGKFDLLPKKEVIQIKKEYDKLQRNLEGIRSMEQMPLAMIVVDPTSEMIAVKEARKMGVPVFGIVDINSDPDLVDYVIPGNDDAVKSISLLLGVLGNAIAESRGLDLIDYTADNVVMKDKDEEGESDVRKD